MFSDKQYCPICGLKKMGCGSLFTVVNDVIYFEKSSACNTIYRQREAMRIAMDMLESCDESGAERILKVAIERKEEDDA